MYSFDNLSSSPGSMSSVLALPVSRGRHDKLVDNFSHESDVTSLQDPFTSRPYKTSFYFYYCVPRKISGDILFQIHVECSPSSRLLVSAHCSLRHRVEDYVSLKALLPRAVWQRRILEITLRSACSTWHDSIVVKNIPGSSRFVDT